MGYGRKLPGKLRDKISSKVQNNQLRFFGVKEGKNWMALHCMY